MTEFHLRLCFAIIVSPIAGLVLGMLFGRWWVLVGLPVYVAVLAWSGPVARWLLNEAQK